MQHCRHALHVVSHAGGTLFKGLFMAAALFSCSVGLFIALIVQPLLTPTLLLLVPACITLVRRCQGATTVPHTQIAQEAPHSEAHSDADSTALPHTAEAAQEAGAPHDTPRKAAGEDTASGAEHTASGETAQQPAALLAEMGFNTTQAKHALARQEGGSAIEWLTRHGDTSSDHDVETEDDSIVKTEDVPPQTEGKDAATSTITVGQLQHTAAPAPSAPSAPLQVTVLHHCLVQELEEMGFASSEAEAAANDAGGNLKQAVKLLMVRERERESDKQTEAAA